MEKRVLLAVSLSFVVLVVYQAFFVPPAPRRAAPAQAPAEKSAGVAPAAPASTPERSAEPQPESPSSSAGSIAVVGDSEERDVIAESQAFRAVFTTRGAELTSWQLKGYFDDQHRIIDELLHAILSPGASLSRARTLKTIQEKLLNELIS